MEGEASFKIGEVRKGKFGVQVEAVEEGIQARGSLELASPKRPTGFT